MFVPFNPKEQGYDLQFWVDASDPSTITLTGNTVTSLQDKGPRNLTLSNGAGFTYNVTKFNGSYPSFYNSETSGANLLGVSCNFAQTLGFLLNCFIVVNRSILTTSSNYLFVAIGTVVLASTSANPSNLRMLGGGNTRSVPMSSDTATSAFISFCRFNGSTAEAWVNGTRVLSNSTLSNTTDNTICVGNRNTTRTLPWNGHICELLMFTEITSAGFNREKTEGYLAHKWGLTGLLPDTHAYKKIRP
jgi:hypothetical protein